jgi:hypothetical protein
MLSQTEPNRHGTPAAGVVLNPSAEGRRKLLIIEASPIHSAIIARIAYKAGFTSETAGCYEDVSNRCTRGGSTASRSTSGSVGTSEPK